MGYFDFITSMEYIWWFLLFRNEGGILFCERGQWKTLDREYWKTLIFLQFVLTLKDNVLFYVNLFILETPLVLQNCQG